MNWFRKNALSYENPEFIIRNPYLILKNKDFQFFKSQFRNFFPIKSIKPLFKANPELHYGESKDFPLFHRLDNSKTVRIFKINEKSAFRPGIVNPHLIVRKIEHKSSNSSDYFTKELMKELPKKKNIISNMNFHLLNVSSSVNDYENYFSKDNLPKFNSVLNESKSNNINFNNKTLMKFCTKSEKNSKILSSNFKKYQIKYF